MFENFRVFETEFAGRPLKIETGKMAQLANGECLVRYGETTIHVAATAAAKPRDGIDFFPLSVDFEEKLYSVGKIPGSFLKREGRPTDKAILVCRMIDRPIRPLFPKDMRNDVSIVCTVMSVDPDCSPEIAALVGTSVALSISDIPWDGPISGVSVGLIDGEFIINPTAEQRKRSQMAVTVASTDERIAMIEGPGHMPLNQIAANMEIQKTLCHGAPFYVLGPIVTDIAPGYDHITSAIGGTVAAMNGASFLCYVTPAEHLRLPDVDDVKEGIIAARIAAHAADIAKGVPHAMDWDNEMAVARKKLDWNAMFDLAIDPEKARRYRESSRPEKEDTCSMCGNFCAVKNMNRILDGEIVSIFDE